jgi:hypothetical protein
MRMKSLSYFLKNLMINIMNFNERTMVEYPYYYAWKNNNKRLTLYLRHCRVLVRGNMNSCLIEFENGQQEIVSRNAIKKRSNNRMNLTLKGRGEMLSQMSSSVAAPLQGKLF